MAYWRVQIVFDDVQADTGKDAAVSAFIEVLEVFVEIKKSGDQAHKNEKIIKFFDDHVRYK